MNDSKKQCEDKILLILDLDETLVYSSENPLERSPDFCIEQYFVYTRPGLEDFLNECNQLYKIAIWTFGSKNYAKEIVNNIFPSEIEPCFIFSRERCSYRFNYEFGVYEVVKPLKKVKRRGFSIERIIIIDDSPETFKDNYGNAILVNKYYGDQGDEELFLLGEFLNKIDKDKVTDIRKVDKRNWRYSQSK